MRPPLRRRPGGPRTVPAEPPRVERTSRRRARLGRAVVVLPSAFTLGNLFFGFWAVVLASRGSLVTAGWLVVYAAVLDWLDGRVARVSRAGSRFGAELDSLADLVSFGVAPALITSRALFSEGEWSWIVCFLFVAAVALRLARFNVEQGGRARRHFLGLPSPAAGGLLATFPAFSGTEFFREQLAAWPWPQAGAIGIVVVAGLMLSHVPYPVLRPGLREPGRRVILGVMLISLGLVVWRPAEAAFPVVAAYVLYGIVRAIGVEVVGQLSGRDPIAEEITAREEAGEW